MTCESIERETVDAKYPRKFGPFVLVTPLLESGGVSLCPAVRLRGSEEQLCLVTHLRPGGRHAPELERRFRRAGEVARRLRHPNVAVTLAVGRLEEKLFIAHEFLDGVDLSRVPADEIDAPTAVFIAREVTHALDYLHRFEHRGLVHLGVAPGNIHVGFDGHIKLLECGLATSLRDEGHQARAFHGSARYAAPEVRNGGEASSRSDVFSVGMLLWDLLAGRRWPGEDPLERGRTGPTFRADGDIEDSDADADRIDSAARSRGPAGLFAVIARAMNPDPARRHADVGELRAALAPFAHGRFAGPRALRALVAQVFDIPDCRRRLAENISAARELRPEQNPLLAGASPRQRAIDWTVRGAGLVALAGLGFLAEGGAGGMLTALPTPATPALVAVERAPAIPTTPAEAPAITLPPTFTPPVSLRPTRAPIRIAPPETRVPKHVGAVLAQTLSSGRPQRSPTAKSPEVQPREEAVFNAGDVPGPQPTAPEFPAAAPRTAADLKARAFDDLKAAEERFQWGDIEGAESLARTAVRNLADNPQAFYLLGVVLLAKGEAKEAKAAFERALALDPKFNDADAKLHLATERATVMQN
jgi:tetratricopeptide (TPR) repeat protein